jgi:hypothetical protein
VKHQLVQPSDHATPADIASWQARMRRAFIDQIGEAEIRDVIKAIADKAKKGDLQAARLLLAYAIGSPPRRDAEPTGPTGARGGTSAKVDVIAHRLANGLPLHLNGDGPEVDLS